MLRKEKGYKRISPAKQRRALQSNIRPKAPVLSTNPTPKIDVDISKVSNHHRRRYLRQFLKDGFIICGICEKKIELVQQLTVDHIIPRSRGGLNNRKNVQPAHRKCNGKKGDTMPPDEIVEEILQAKLPKNLQRPKPKTFKEEVEELIDNVIDKLYPM